MDHLAAMRAFVAVVETQGFSAAGRALSMPLQTVSRKVAELEQHLGAQLLVRTTRKVTVTDGGQSYYEDVRRILEDIDDAERQASGEYRSPKGRLSVTAPTLFGRLHVLPIVVDFMKAHRDIKIRLFLTNDVVDLLENNVDLGVRIGNLSHSSMIAVDVGSVRQIVCASPRYLAQNGLPGEPGDLAELDCVTWLRADHAAEWKFKMPSGRVRNFAVRSSLALNSIEGHVRTALLDAGLVQLYAYQGASQVAEGKLEIVMEGYEIDPQPVHLVYPQSGRIPQKLRAFVDFATPRLRERLDLIASQCSTPRKARRRARS